MVTVLAVLDVFIVILRKSTGMCLPGLSRDLEDRVYCTERVERVSRMNESGCRTGSRGSRRSKE